MKILKIGADKNKLVKKINEFYCEEYKNLDNITYGDLLWFLETLFVNYDVLNEEYKKLAKMKAKGK
jgi:hypothetical protein